MILFTDFGWQGPYVGQLHLAVAVRAPGLAVVDLMHDLPAYDVQAGACLLAAQAPELPPGATVVAVVDPGGGGRRRPLILEADARRYVGPDNGVLESVAALDPDARAWRIDWRPERLSASFHGRDLFAPVAAMLAAGRDPDALGTPVPVPRRGWPGDLPRIIYLDGFGNAMTGLRAAGLAANARLEVAGRRLPRARTFCDVAPGEAFWYANSSALVEVAVNQGSAAAALGLAVGDPVRVV